MFTPWRFVLKMTKVAMASRQKTQAETSGRRAEIWSAFCLRLKGYSIINRRVKTPFGEIDLIARKGRTLVFIEVKYRKTRIHLDESLTPQAQKRIVRAARYYISRQPRFQSLTQRFDLMLISPRGVFPYGYMRHMIDAWRTY